MAKLTKWFWFTVVALFTSAALAQEPEPRARTFAQPELDQMLAPIALYPDSLLTQILMAATYPRDVAQAASWSRANGRLSGDQAVRAVEREPWDPSVISLAAFPEILEMMAERMDWTERLGDAFIGQQTQVMDTVQELRRRADEAGTLRSSEEMVVQRQGYDYVIEPSSPETMHVPYYDPNLAYGNWMWPDYSPVYWGPWAGYDYHAGYPGFGWGYGIYLGPGFFFGAVNWRHRYTHYSSHRPWYHHSHYRSGTRWTSRNNHRDGRWSGGDRSGSRDGRWQNGDRTNTGYRTNTNTGDRTNTGDSRWRDRDGRTDRRDGRGDRRVQSPAPAPSTAQQGFFPPRSIETQAAQAVVPGHPGIRSVSPRVGMESAPRAARPEVVEGRALVGRQNSTRAPAPVAIPERVAPVRTERAAVGRPERSAQAPVQRVAPVERAAPAPVQRVAPVQRQAPERAERAERAERSERAESSPVERSSSGRAGNGNGRNR